MNPDDQPVDDSEGQTMFLEALEEQLGSPDTPEVKAELTRLIADGTEPAEAKQMMATILAFHVVRLVKSKGKFDYPAYVAELRRLPDIDFDQKL